ncbi:MAG TPA: hypothetical protein DCX06_03005 [Opitutae bacterium]|nr:hypothetical protein [Opitutae bacterium]
MDIAIVTGAETPLGLRIIEGLIQQGCRVHGIGNNLSKVTYADRNFIAHAIDVSDLTAVQKTASEILEKEGALHILIHAIDVTPGGSFENLPVGNLEAILKIGLLGPVMLTRMALPNLLRYRGQLINVIPANKSGHAPSAVNALIEGGLREINTALFDQARDAGLKLTNLILRQNTELPAATISDDQLNQTRIDLEQVARTIDYLLNANESNVPNEITLHPRLSQDATKALPEAPLPVDPYNAIVLPPAEYCPPEQPKIPTKQPESISRTIPYSDEEMEEKIAAAIEDFEEHPERYEAKAEKPAPKKHHDNKPQNQDAESGSSKRRRGRRRGGRNRNRNREENESQAPQQSEAQNKQSQPNPQKTSDSKAIASPTEQEQFISKKPNNRRRRGRKPEQAKGNTSVQAPAHKESTASKPKSEKTSKPAPKETQVDTAAPKPSESKPVKKKAAKKVVAKKTATKKSAKKTAAKKTPAKKAAKKAAKKTAKKTAVKNTATKGSLD